MGLDMYILKRSYKNYTGDKPVATSDLQHVRPERVKSLEEEVAYWRKANQIHGWFCRQFDNGYLDSGERLYLEPEMLEALLEDINKVLAAKDTPEAEAVALELLPPTTGFFFGPDEIDEWYYHELQHTRELLPPVIAEMRELHNQAVSWYYVGDW